MYSIFEFLGSTLGMFYYAYMVVVPFLITYLFWKTQRQQKELEAQHKMLNHLRGQLQQLDWAAKNKEKEP